ncbi:MAG: PatB family C-S lyase, partial [Clostridia bacterium]|nr:PatB family C-S lyase [Clostridia bacterium]
MEYNFDKEIKRHGTDSLKWERNQMMRPVPDNPGINSLWVADMDFPCPEPVVTALTERARHPVYGYTFYNKEKLTGAFTAWTRARCGWKLSEGDVYHSPGVVAAINFLINGLTSPGDGIIIQRPVYYPFTRVIENNGRTVLNNALINEGGRYHMDFDDLERKASLPKTRMMVLCSPHNPVGRVWTEEELGAVGDICLRNGVVLVSDEIHSDLVAEGVKFVPASLAGHPDNTITCMAPSKTFNIPGLMMSATIIHNKEHAKIWEEEAYGKAGFSLPNPFATAAFEAAYSKGGEWLDQVLGYIGRNLGWMGGFIERNMPGVAYVVPEGTYLAWLDLNGA